MPAVTDSLDFDELTPPASFPTEPEFPERIWRNEHGIRVLAASLRRYEQERQSTRRWMVGASVTIGVAMLGAIVTVVIAFAGAAVAYGELRQMARSNAEAIQDMRVEISRANRDVNR